MLSVAIGMAAALPAESRGASQAPEQPAAVRDAEAQGEIIVIGSRERRDPVVAFVEAVTVQTGDQIAKFATPVCPASFGLPPEHNRLIETRMREIAGFLGIGAGAEGCRPNVVVVIVEQAGDFMHRLRRDRPDVFNSLEPEHIRAIMRLSGPVRAWQVVEARGSDGRPMQRISFLETGPGQAPRPVANGYLLTGVVPSLTSRPTRQDLSLSFIVFDLDAVAGLTLIQIADHAAMRALARTEVAGLPARRSILTLFSDRNAGAAPAEELTNWDAAYLGALYRTNNGVTAHQQRSSMSRTMRRELESASGPESARP